MKDQMIVLESPQCPIWEGGSPTGQYKTSTAIVNKSMIASIVPYVGTNLHKGWNCSKVTVNLGDRSEVHYDVRLPHLLHEWIKK